MVGHLAEVNVLLATVKLVDNPRHTALAVLGYADMATAAEERWNTHVF